MLIFYRGARIFSELQGQKNSQSSRGKNILRAPGAKKFSELQGQKNSQSSRGKNILRAPGE